MLLRVYTANVLVLGDTLDGTVRTDSDPQQSHRSVEGEAAGARFAKGQHILVVGVKGVPDGAQAVISALGSGKNKGQLYVSINGEKLIRIWADSAEPFVPKLPPTISEEGEMCA